jgi:hypothetical protein
MPKRGPNKRVMHLFDYFDYNLFGIKLVNALNDVHNADVTRLTQTQDSFISYCSSYCCTVLVLIRSTKYYGTS